MCENEEAWLCDLSMVFLRKTYLGVGAVYCLMG
jgi:hypothetical protein